MRSGDPGPRACAFDQHGRPAAVMVSPEQWNRLMARLEDLQDALDIAEARRDLGPTVSLDDYLAQR